MTTQELQDIVLRNASEISDVRREVSDLTAKEKRAATALQNLRTRLETCLLAFDRDKYKSTDHRLVIEALASEILIFERLGYDIGLTGSHFTLGVSAFLAGRNQAALEHFKDFLRVTDSSDQNIQNANYLAAMICYNRRDFNQALDFFETTFRLSKNVRVDWQSRIYIGELLSFLRKPKDVVEKAFFDVEEPLRAAEDTIQNKVLRATLYLKLGNCYVETFLEPKQRNPMVNNDVAIGYYKQARRACPQFPGSESLLPVVIDSSLAQALLLGNSVDMDLEKTPSELLADVFNRLRRIVLTKREEIILAQSYFMLGTCAVYSSYVSRDAGEIYFEYARHQTLNIPSDVCFYSSISKELLSRDDFVWQIDHYAQELEQQARRR